ncbi:hypothetical protein LSTR_LSTR011879, partial [Laodelphax striatellus]
MEAGRHACKVSSALALGVNPQVGVSIKGDQRRASPYQSVVATLERRTSLTLTRLNKMGHLLHFRVQLVLTLLGCAGKLCWAAENSAENQLPSDAELLSTWRGGGGQSGHQSATGQPEEISPLAGLASDEESFNRLMVLAHMHPGYYHSVASGQGGAGGQAPSGTFHFVSSTFP